MSSVIKEKVKDKKDRMKDRVKDKLTSNNKHGDQSRSSEDSSLSRVTSHTSSQRQSTSSRPASSYQQTWSPRASVDTRPRSSDTSASGRHLSQHQSELLAYLAERKYVLRTTCGASYDSATHVSLPVNSPQAVTVSNEFMTVHIKLRIRNFRGLPLSSQEHTPYFEDPTHTKDQYSVAFSFVPKVDIPSVDCRWGNDFDHPVRDRLPPGFNTAFKIVKEFIDPGLTCDAYGEQPWVFGPATSCWFVMRVGEEVSEEAANKGDFPQPLDSPAMVEGGEGSGIEARASAGLPEDGEKRRKWMLKETNRKQFVFEKGRWYQGDFYNPYLDFNNFALKLPGFSLTVTKYINDKSHQLRYVFKNVGTGDVYFVVVLTLLFGEHLQTELAQAGGTTGVEDSDPDDEVFEDALEDQEDTMCG